MNVAIINGARFKGMQKMEHNELVASINSSNVLSMRRGDTTPTSSGRSCIRCACIIYIDFRRGSRNDISTVLIEMVVEQVPDQYQVLGTDDVFLGHQAK